MAASREIITIEERAINNLSFKIPDNNNLIINNQKISLNNNEYLYSKINIDDLINHLKNLHYNVEKSIDAGKYICNFLYYKVLEEYDVPSIFIHIPPYKEKVDFDLLNNLLNEVIMYLKKL
jgi:pyrrolidone-carboxylate peptidase